MVKIKDRLTLAAVSSAIAYAPPRLLNYAQRHLGYSDIHYEALIASLFLPKYKSKNRISQFMGTVGNLVNGAIVASTITYLLSATGKDKAILKGMGLDAALWVLVYGVFMGTIPSRKPLAPLLSLIDHLIYGGVCAAAICYLGDDSLFPDNTTVHGKLPLIHTGSV